MSLLTALIEHPALWPAPEKHLYICPLRDYRADPCPTPLRRACYAPKCATHGSVMRLVRPSPLSPRSGRKG